MIWFFMLRFLPPSGIEPHAGREINNSGIPCELRPVMIFPSRRARRAVITTLLTVAVAIVFAPGAPFQPATRGAVASHGTLVVVVPFNHGLVVAADGRQTLFNRIYCDGTAKIIETTRPRTIAAVTGNGVVVDYPHPVPDEQMCSFIKDAPRIFDIEAVVRRFLDSSSGSLQSLNLEPLMEQCLGEVIKLDRSLPGFLVKFLGTTMFQVVLAGYDAETSTSVIRTFSGRIERDGRFVFQFNEDKTYSPETTADWLTFGEADYFNAHVLGPEGQPFYDKNIFERMKGHRIAEIERDSAIALAEHSIEAAAKTTSIIPAATGIGGPIETLVVGGDPKPERIGR
jgi:hypothetical protein